MRVDFIENYEDFMKKSEVDRYLDGKEGPTFDNLHEVFLKFRRLKPLIMNT